MQNNKLQIEYLPTDQLQMYDGNANIHSAHQIDQIAESIEKFDFSSPILAWHNENGEAVIVAGHGRLMAARKLGIEELPVVFLDHMTDEQRRAFTIVENQLTRLSEFDMGILEVELENITNIDMSQFDFDVKELQIDAGGDWFESRERNDTSREDGNDDYNDFLDKFEVKKTTDDCYTPDLVYDAVLDWVRNEYGIYDDAKIVRPFYPNGDYEHEDYPDGCVVVDNPPFSILSEILRFYIDNSVKFFLFAPALTLFSPRVDCCRIPTGVSITYENGANVSTSFMTNLDTDNAIRTAPDLYKTVDSANKQNREELSKPVNLKYKYPSHVITSAMVSGWCELGVEFSIPKGNEYQVGCLDAQKEYDKTIFGSGFLLSDECAREAERAKADAERAKADAERAKALEAAKALGDGVEVEPDGSVVWRLSERELAIIEGLGK